MKKHYSTSTLTKILIAILIFALILLLIITIQPSIFTYGKLKDTLGSYHEVGDALGGMTGPIIGLISALLVYLSFQEQIKANKIVMESRRDDNLMAYLSNYYDKVERKYEAILGDGYESKFNFDCSKICKSYLELSKYSDEIYDITKRGDDMVSNINSDIVAVINDIAKMAPLMDNISNLAQYCNFYSGTLKLALGRDLSPISQDMIMRHVSEFVFFLDNKILHHLKGIEKFDPNLLPPEWDVKKAFIRLKNSITQVDNDSHHFKGLSNFVELFERL